MTLVIERYHRVTTEPTTSEFMTAKQLGLSGDYYEALIAVLGKLESGEIVHYQMKMFGEPVSPKDKPLPAMPFNMDVWDESISDFTGNHCGTVGCIGYWVSQEIMIKNNLYEIDIDPGYDALEGLFFPNNLHDWGTITTADAVKAIRNYLTDGNPGWAKVRPDLCAPR